MAKILEYLWGMRVQVPHTDQSLTIKLINMKKKEVKQKEALARLEEWITNPGLSPENIERSKKEINTLKTKLHIS
jgi:hypothetical protein